MPFENKPFEQVKPWVKDLITDKQKAAPTDALVPQVDVPVVPPTLDAVLPSVVDAAQPVAISVDQTPVATAVPAASGTQSPTSVSSATATPPTVIK